MKIYIEDNMCTTFKLVLHRLEKTLEENDHSVVAKPEKADICIAGVCAAFNADEARSVNLLKKLKKAGKPVYAYGCLTQVNPKKINTPNKIASWSMDYLLTKLIGKDFGSWNREKMPFDFRSKRDYRVYDLRKKFIGISIGCAFNCSYCPHKIGSGSMISIPINEILDLIEEVNRSKVDTIILTAIDTACYGKDIGLVFADLLEKVLKKLRKDIDVHVAQFNPEGLFFNRKKLLKSLSDKRIKDFQLPVQTSSRRLLKLMNRNYSPAKVAKFISDLKKKNKNIMIRTDIIVGFPTETKKELEETIKFVCNNFDEVAVYSFEVKKETFIASLDIKFLSLKEIEKRRQYALEKVKAAGLLAHSGAQKLSSLIKTDKIKAQLRKKK